MALHPADVTAGVSVALVLIPQSLAYAQLAELPPYRGLLAAAIPPLIAAPFGSSPYLQPGPTAVTSLLTFGALTSLAPPGSGPYLEDALVLALLVGLVRLAVGLSRAGVIAYLLSQPILVGFVPAAAILIVATQIPAAFGSRPPRHHVLVQASWVLTHVTRWQPTTVGVSIAVIAMLLLGRRLGPRFPAVAFTLGLGLVVGHASGWGGARIGSVRAGFPPLTTHVPLSVVPALVVPAITIALIGFAEASSIAQTYAALDRKPWNADREFVAQGFANLAAGLSGGFPVGASFSRSALNRLAGAQTRMSGFVTGLAVLAFLPLGYILQRLPTAVLAATVIVAVTPLIRLDRIVTIATYSRVQLSVVATAFILTLLLAPHLEWALLAAVALSLGIHLWRELRLDIQVSFGEETLALRPQGVLWFGTTRRLEEGFLSALAEHAAASNLVIHLDALGRIDISGALVLERLVEDARAAGLMVSIEGIPGHAAPLLARIFTASPFPGPCGHRGDTPV